MKKQKKKIIWLVLITGAIIGIAVIGYLFRPTSECVCNKKAVATIAATELLNQYETDEEKANNLYLGNVIAVEGIISSVESDDLNRAVVAFESQSFGTVACTLCEKESEMEKLTEGTTVTIKGQCSGYTFDVVLVKCCLVN
jgi:hypothetical protein